MHRKRCCPACGRTVRGMRRMRTGLAGSCGRWQWTTAGPQATRGSFRRRLSRAPAIRWSLSSGPGSLARGRDGEKWIGGGGGGQSAAGGERTERLTDG